MVRVEAQGLPGGLAELVRGEVEHLEDALRFVDLHAALCRPGIEDFLLLVEGAFVLEVELDNAHEVAQFRRETEVELDALGADWMMSEYDEEDTMSRRKRRVNNRMGGWD